MNRSFLSLAAIPKEQDAVLHTALFVAAIPNDKRVWEAFINAVDGKASLHPQATVRLAENVWLILV